MWGDELLVPLNAARSIPYILSLSADAEVHPPYFYFLYKFLLLFGTSDFWLRLPSTICGILSLYFVWRTGERHLGSRFAALAGLGILTVHPLHIWISRQVRPYALVMMCTALSVDYLLRYLENGRSREAWRNILSNIPIVTIHYLGFFVLASQWVCVLVSYLARKIPKLTSIALYGFGSALCILPSVYFLWEAKFKRHEPVIASGNGFISAFHKILQAFDGVLAFNAPFPYAWSILGGLTFLGTLALITRRSIAAYLAFFVVIPPAILLSMGYSSHLYAVHLSFLLPPIVMLAGVGLARGTPLRLRRPWTILMLCTFLGGSFLGLQGEAYYSPKGVVATWWNLGNFKDVGQTLRANFTPEDMIAFRDLELYQYVNYYAERAGGFGAPSTQVLGPEKPMVKTFFLTNYEAFGQLFSGEDEFKKLFGASAKVATLSNLRVYQAAVARYPNIVMDGERFVVQLTAAPMDVYARAWSLRDLSVWPYNGCSLFPTKPNQTGEVIYHLIPAEGNPPRNFCLMVDYNIEASGNSLQMDYRFDDEDWETILTEHELCNYDEKNMLARFARQKKYNNLWIRIRLKTNEEVATTNLGTLGQVKLHHITIFGDNSNSRFGSSSLSLQESGLGDIELLPGYTFIQWGLGPNTSIKFELDKPEMLNFHYSFSNYIQGQSVEILFDGKAVALHKNLTAGQEITNQLTLMGHPGPGLLEFRYSTWNNKNEASSFAPDEPRNLAVAFRTLSMDVSNLVDARPSPQILERHK
ncbi:MAG: hypothetical protein FD177_656 [Desulfovibrionaceae bacterium]|nr:MAG: hypothetical protein FD177_656 [Desulfovibrionaceae bacterium]